MMRTNSSSSHAVESSALADATQSLAPPERSSVVSSSHGGVVDGGEEAPVDRLGRSSSPFNAATFSFMPVVMQGRPPPSPPRASGDRLVVMITPTYRIILVGDPAVGKSNLITRFANGTFDLFKPTTIGVEFVLRRVQLSPKPEDCINVQLYDTAGQDTFTTLTPVFVRPAHGILVVYDVTRRDTFLNVPGWIAQIKRWVSEDAVIAVIGNKTDLNHQVEIPEEEAIDVCSRLGCRHFIASARSGDGVGSAFLHVVLACHSLACSKSTTNAAAPLRTPGGGVKGHTPVPFRSGPRSAKGDGINPDDRRCDGKC